MATVLEIEQEQPKISKVEEEEISPIEEVRLTVSTLDDPTLPIWTFRMWVLGLISCAALSFINQFFYYRTEPLIITQITIQIASLPIGKFMAYALPTTKFHIPGLGDCSLNPGPFNLKEHVLISMFANAGSGFGQGPAYAIGIVDIIKAFYKRKISFLTSMLLVITTQVLGYGWAGVMRKYVVEPAIMWWPATMPQVSLFRALHEKDPGEQWMSKGKFFIIACIASFVWALVPGYLFPTLSALSLLCFAFPKSVTAHQIGSGMHGLGIGSFSFDWSLIASYMYSPLISPFFATANVAVGYALVVYVVTPVTYWGMNLYNAKTFPIFSPHLFTSQGNRYNISAIVNDKFELDALQYAQQGRINLSTFFAVTYGIGFAAVAATLTHVGLFHGKEIWDKWRASRSSRKEKEDIHTRLMKEYKDIPNWWFYLMLAATFVVSLLVCFLAKDEVQMPWWALILACAIALIFTLPISIITATTNQTPGLNIITEYLMGLMLPGKPIANVCFKTYGYISMTQAIAFLQDFKLGHYMKIPPKSMFLVQLIGTIIAGVINTGTAWYMLNSVKNICQDDLLPANSPWTCAQDRVFYDASVIWGLASPKRIFGVDGNYIALNWFFLGGALAPALVWVLHRKFKKQTWIALINMPIILQATAMMPPASSVNLSSWIVVGVIFNYFVFKYRKNWWQRYNYVLSAALDAGVAIMSLFIYFALSGTTLNWWGTGGEYCDLATCPTAKGVVVDGCPVF
ncbi:oligopeptide transporter 4-like [Papaver somniferum]|uniref:oligopeptide transporter 4-like n=1 Tax=Papaver somniferum TaxID=3469 RepID=UPI000E6FEC53|nr:oligopeptide transporter 4-like [Papaver somniferum]